MSSAHEQSTPSSSSSSEAERNSSTNSSTSSSDSSGNGPDIAASVSKVLDTVKEQIFPPEGGTTPLQRQIQKGREIVNDTLAQTENKIPVLADAINPSSHGQVLKRRVCNWSTQINETYPYPSMLLRTHGSAITITSTALLMYGTRRFGRKVALFTGMTTAALCLGGIKLVNFKWKQPNVEK
jgi:hypothetical protein